MARFLSVRALPFQRALMSTYHESKYVIGNREIVGFGFNGKPGYVDRPDFPFPAIRWKPPSSDIQALREKEKGDWRKLSIDEKKALYRASYRRTFAEMKAPTGEWKSVVGCTLMLMALSIWLAYFVKVFVYKKMKKIHTFDEELRAYQMRRIIDLRANPIQGISSLWDYENDDWKK